MENEITINGIKDIQKNNISDLSKSDIVELKNIIVTVATREEWRTVELVCAGNGIKWYDNNMNMDIYFDEYKTDSWLHIGVNNILHYAHSKYVPQTKDQLIMSFSEFNKRYNKKSIPYSIFITKKQMDSISTNNSYWDKLLNKFHIDTHTKEIPLSINLFKKKTIKLTKNNEVL